MLLALALTQWDLGQHEAARQTLSQAEPLMDEHMPKLHGGELGGDWPYWVVACILRKELADRMGDLTAD